MVIKSIFLLTTIANMMVPASIQNPEQLLGSYQRLPIENPWHEGRITFREQSPFTLRWTNQAGVSWDLFPIWKGTDWKLGSKTLIINLD